jgi:hypothetical protein
MTPSKRRAKSSEPRTQRNALAPGLLATLVLLIGVAAIGSGAFVIVQFIITILALIVAWFAVQARHWWWVPVFVAVAVIWNPVFPIELPEAWWVGAHYLAILAFVLAGVLINTEAKAAERN